jgi:hypothetical protein
MPTALNDLLKATLRTNQQRRRRGIFVESSTSIQFQLRQERNMSLRRNW